MKPAPPAIGPTRRACLRALAAAPLAACTTLAVETPVRGAGRVFDLGDLVLVSGPANAARYEGGAALQRTVARVHDLSFRLRSRAGAACGPVQAPLWGFVALNLALLQPLGLEPSAPALGIDERLTVFHVVAASPAAVAGLQAGDVIQQLDGRPLPAGEAALEFLGRRLAAAGPPLVLDIRRGGASQRVSITAQPACAMRAVLASDHHYLWDGADLPVEHVGDAMLAFAIAQTGALQSLPARRSMAGAGAQLGESVDFGLSMLSLIVGIATLGGWSAKPVDIFDDGAADRQRSLAASEFRTQATLAADRAALRQLQAAGLGFDDIVARWRSLAEPRAEGEDEDTPRLRALKAEMQRLAAGAP